MGVIHTVKTTARGLAGKEGPKSPSETSGGPTRMLRRRTQAKGLRGTKFTAVYGNGGNKNEWALQGSQENSNSPRGGGGGG